MRSDLTLIGLAAATMLATIAGAAETPATPTATVTATPDPMQQMVCRKDLETGSLVRTKKTCHTRAQWAYIDDINQNDSRKLVEDNMTRPAGN